MDTFAFLGTPEIIIILIVALIVFGPQKLPEIGRQIGAAMREMRKMSSEVQRALDLDEYGGNSTSSYSSYESGRWYDRGTAGTAPAGTVAASGDALALPSGGTASDEEFASYAPENPAHADPPGPPARLQTAPLPESGESGQHGGAAVI